ncbi:GTP pyrophosphokinase [Anaerococcus octavius]|uniref:GTP diphosphokinase n=1 Tax=Anaerococcus octavius TaxID=54007 RepID=A0A380WT84_9FIRM|nr:bifunctional (p)ppGpp synthetase/guanosine-3',5'-bis(diphosphate) 3'-pyrophosphohydrolase [Anaerococcus octavius]SUU92247.1 GTP pyrophosphokinase [Anaerococcus octavius]
MTTDFDLEYEKLKEIILENNPKADMDLIKKAYYFGEVNHRGQKRNSGEDYFIHPIAVAKTLSNMKLDDQTICSGLMHDVLEDTSVTYDQMEKEFGHEITFLVDGVTKLKNLNYSSREEKQAENIRKMVMAMSNDVRVVLIKLADRLHNMRTLEYKTREKQIQTATETLEIYVPLAHRLGIYSIKWELEDLCFRYQEPEKYYELAEMVSQKRREREAYINEIIETLTDSLKDSNIDFEISGRPKSLYSIYKKMIRNDIVFEEIYDLTAVRVLVDTIAECYAVLGKVHSLWKPIPNRIKDYIGQPKPNGYRSLHTTVFGEDSRPFEVQIRTRQMHKECEYGVAAHWRYKENNTKESDFDNAMEFLRRIMEWQNEGGADSDSKEFMETLKTDFFSREIYVYSPAGEIYSLPIGSCAIDFAYKVHTEVGNKCIGAKVNSSIVPITQKLKTGDVVEILTSKNSAGPSKDWLNIVKSHQAKNKIKQFFKKNGKEENIEQGKNQIIRDIKKHREGYKSLLKDEWVDEISNELGFPTKDEMYAAVGYGRITSEQVIQKLIKREKELEEKEKAINEPIELVNKTENKPSTSKGEVRVSDFDDDIEVKFAKCCTPIPGDPIIGFITKGNGISVHTKSCPNIINNHAPERLIDVYWQNGASDKFPVKIQVAVANSPSVIYDITKMISTVNVNISGINARLNENQEGVIDLTVEVNSLDQLDDVMAKLKSLNTVYSVYRVNN